LPVSLIRRKPLFPGHGVFVYRSLARLYVLFQLIVPSLPLRAFAGVHLGHAFSLQFGLLQDVPNPLLGLCLNSHLVMMGFLLRFRTALRSVVARNLLGLLNVFRCCRGCFCSCLCVFGLFLSLTLRRLQLPLEEL